MLTLNEYEKNECTDHCWQLTDHMATNHNIQPVCARNIKITGNTR